jgi:hypothetical protein
MRNFITIVGPGLLVFLSATISDARQHGKQLNPTQSDVNYSRLKNDPARSRDGSCFSRSTGLLDEFACSSYGG